MGDKESSEVGRVMAYSQPVTHKFEGYAVFQVVRDSDLHRTPVVLGLVMQRAFLEYPGVPVVAVLVDDEVRLDDGE